MNASKQYLNANNGCDDPETFMTKDFTFMGPFVGPLSRERFVKAFTSFELQKAIPDLTGNLWGFHADPQQPNRVWYFSRLNGTHSGYLANVVKPTGKKIESPPEAISLTFDMDSGKVKKMTVGHVMDVSEGNTGGLGGVFGIFYRVGSPLPFREARPYRKSLFYRLYDAAPQPFKVLLFAVYPILRPLGAFLVAQLRCALVKQKVDHLVYHHRLYRFLIAVTHSSHFGVLVFRIQAHHS